MKRMIKFMIMGKLIVLCLVLMSCSSNERIGGISIRPRYVPPHINTSFKPCSLPPGSDKVIITITGTDFKPIVREVSVATNPSGTTINGIPSGHERSVGIEVQDALHQSIAKGKTAGIVIRAGSTSTVDILITQVGVFTQLKTNVLPRAFAVSSPLPDGRYLIMGGMSDQQSTCGSGCVQLAATRSTEIYDPDTGTFEKGPDMKEPRVFFSAAVIADGSIAVLGGSDLVQVSCSMAVCTFSIPDNHAKNSIEVFDPASKSFYKAQSLAIPRAGQTADRVGENTLLVAGGTGNSGPLATAELIDIKTGSNILLTMSTARAFQTSITYRDDALFLAGGTVSNGQTEFFQSAAFIPSTTITCPFYFPSAVYLNSTGIAVVNGGIGADGQPVSSFMVVDPVKRIVLSYHSMPLPRAFFSDMVLGDGTILLAGGIADSDFSVFRTAEIFDPGSKSFVSSAVLNSARAGYAAQSLRSGAALLVSGFSNINPLTGDIAFHDTAELFNP